MSYDLSKYIFFIIIAGFVQLANSAPSSHSVSSNNPQEIASEYLKKYKDIENISAVSLTADTGHDRTNVYVGDTAISNNIAVNETNLYQIGSITKSFIAVIILQLETDPNLHFDINDKLSKYLPQYAKWGKVTIKQLLNMTSGIPDYLTDNYYLQDLASNPYKRWLPEEQMSYVIKKQLLFIPGTRWDYSNTNYILLGMIISKLTGRTIEDEITNRFLALNNSSHLNLMNTFYVSHQYPKLIESRLVHGYRFGGNIGKWIPLKTDVTQYSLSYAGAAGAMVSNSEDVTLWIRTLFTTTQVLQAKQLNELKTLVSTTTGKPVKKLTAEDPNGFGLGIGFSYVPDFPSLVINFEGMTMGYRAQYIFILDKNLIIAATTNSSVDQDNDHLIELLNDTYEVLIKKH